MFGTILRKIKKKNIEIQKKLKDFQKFSKPVLRIGIALVFLWFGITQLINPESFLGYVPQFFANHSASIVHNHPLQLLHNIPITPHILIIINGILETILGLFLILGVFIKISSLILALHLTGIMFSLGYNDIAVRDFGLIIATFAIFLNGYDKYTIKIIFNKFNKG